MASSTSTFATLKALHLVIADALDDIQRVFAQNSTLEAPSSPPSPRSSPVFPSSPDPSPATSPFPVTPPASFPPTPLSGTFPSPPQAETSVPYVDYPSPDLPLVPNSLAEQLALHPDAVAASSRIVSACGQLSNIVHKPFSSLCDAIMSYNLPACMRLVEHLHVAEILREAEEHRQRCLVSGNEAATPLSAARVDRNGVNGLVSSTPTSDAVDIPTPRAEIGCMPRSRAHRDIGMVSSLGVHTWWVDLVMTLSHLVVFPPSISPTKEGLHVTDITNIICSYAGNHYIDPCDLVHVLRLLSTHHIFRETAPDTFALNRVASLLDSGKSVKAVFSSPEAKYDGTGGTPAFVGLTTDELFKSAAYLTEAFTGVQLPTQLPTLASTPNPSCRVDAASSGTTAIQLPSSYVVDDPALCAATARSSSALTHIVYPEDEDVQLPSCLLSSTKPVENDRLCSLAALPMPSQLFAAESPAPPPRLSTVEASTYVEKDRLHSGGAAKPERLLGFNLAFRTHAPLFEWLENGGEDPLGGTGSTASICTSPNTRTVMHGGLQLAMPSNAANGVARGSFRLQRFSKAMVATAGWEAPKAILSGFDWCSLPKGSTIVDVGGGIGSTTMILARALNDPRADALKKQDSVHSEGIQPTSTATTRHRSKRPSDPSLATDDEPRNNAAPKSDAGLRFVVQDKSVVTALGIEAWRSKCPEMLESGQVVFQDQDFFEPQPHLEPPHSTRHPAVYLLRVVLHDWPDELARRILINLRVASNPDTRLVIAEHVLPLACVDEDVTDHLNIEACEGDGTEEWTLNTVLANVEGAERTLVPPPLLSNLGKASANAYWMDLIMQISLNGKERTLREFCALGLSAGWRVTRMTRPEGSLFAYLVCEPIALSDDAQAIYQAVVLSSELSTVVIVPSDEPAHHSQVDPSRHKRLPPRPMSLLPSPMLERSSSRCGTPTFGSRMLLPKEEDLQSPRPRGAGAAKKWLKSKGLGVRSVMMQKAEKQREEQSLAKGASARDNGGGQSEVPASASHVRVWWKKSPPHSTSNSSTAVHELNGDVPERRTTGRAWRGTLKSNDRPSTPSPRLSPRHQNWPSIESTTPPIPGSSPPVSRIRRPSVPSITRKLSFATFGRRPSIADITEPLPTPPPGAILTELAPPPTLHGDTGRSLKHLPSLPTLGRSEVVNRTLAAQPAIPRRPSLSFAGQMLLPQPALKSAAPRRPDVAESPKSGILKSRTSPYASKQSSPETRNQAESVSTSIPRHRRRMTLSNAPGGSSSQVQTPGSSATSFVPRPDPDPAGAEAEARRVPSVPKLPRRLSIPILRRKQSQSVVRGGENVS